MSNLDITVKSWNSEIIGIAVWHLKDVKQSIRMRMPEYDCAKASIGAVHVATSAGVVHLHKGVLMRNWRC